MMKKYGIALGLIIVAALHQDFWLWSNSRLVLGCIPIGLAYHACYSVLAAITLAVLVKIAWPSHLEHVEPIDPTIAEKSKQDGGH